MEDIKTKYNTLLQEEILKELKKLNSNNKFNEQRYMEDEIDLIELLLCLLKRWYILMLTIIIAATASFGVSYKQYIPTYRTSTLMYVNNSSLSIGVTQISITSSDISSSTALISVYQAVLKTHFVLDEVGKKLEDKGYENLNYKNLISKISCASVDDTPVFSIVVNDTDPERAIDIANTIAEVLPEKLSSIIDGTSARVVDHATTAHVNGSNIVKNTMMGAMAGLVVSAGLVILFDYFLDDSIKDPSVLTNAPVLGKIPDASKKDSGSYYYYRKKGGRKHEDA